MIVEEILNKCCNCNRNAKWYIVNKWYCGTCIKVGRKEWRNKVIME